MREAGRANPSKTIASSLPIQGIIRGTHSGENRLQANMAARGA